MATQATMLTVMTVMTIHPNLPLTAISKSELTQKF
jgi:hypothetical protein